MARILITGSADGLGLFAARELIAQGNNVVLHARNAKRAEEALSKAPGAETAFIADLSVIAETIELGKKLNASGSFDAVIHNAGVYNVSAKALFAVNTLAPYILTCLIDKPNRLIYLSSEMQRGGRSKLDSFTENVDRINYSDTKLHVLMLCKAVARKWPGVFANAVNPGWVPTKMGGKGAPDDLKKGYETQVWLAASNDPRARVAGRYFHHQHEVSPNAEADDISLQDRFLHLCEQITGVPFG